MVHRARPAIFTDAESAFSNILPGSLVYIEGGVGHPISLIKALMKRGGEVGRLTIITSLMGPAPPYCSAEVAETFNVLSFRGSPETADSISSGQVDIVPANLSAIPRILCGPLRPEVALIQLTPPNNDGYCSLGASVLYHKDAISASGLVIAEINSEMPWTFGDSLIHLSEVDFLIEGNHPLPTLPKVVPSEPELRLAENVVEYVPDSCTVQVGMGSIAQAIMEKLCSRSGLRIHSGLLSDGVMTLAASGALANEGGSIVSGAFYGSEQLYRFIDRNPQVSLQPVQYTHSADVIRTLGTFISINSAVEVDLSGQVNAEYVRGMPISGAGGQGDFVRAAALASYGRTIIALTATSKNKRYSKIVNRIADPVVVTTARTDVDVIATEFGVAELQGKGLAQRAEALLAVSDPIFRPLLRKGDL